MEAILAIMVGIGLSAACGFRVFMPLTGLSIASLSGHLTLSPEFAWIGTWTALIAFATASILEIAAYYIPWLDNLMDSLMTPAAVIAGIMVTASVVTDMSPFLKWSLAIIAGGGTAAIVQGGTVAMRTVSSGATGGFANFSLSTVEISASLVLTILAILLPVICILVTIWICLVMIKKIFKSPFIRKLI